MKSTRPHGLGPTRAKVLALLEEASSPTSVNEIAETLGIHRNSARFHLDALVSAGYAESAVAASGAQGRPPLLYTATATAPTLSNAHLLELAEALLTHVSGTSADAVASTHEAGRSWGATVATTPRIVQPGPTDEVGRSWGATVATPGLPPCAVASALTQELAGRGFGTSYDGETLAFRRCPFRHLIRDDSLPLVCAVHQGFLDGYLEASGGDLRAGRLRVGEEICTVPLSAEPENG